MSERLPGEFLDIHSEAPKTVRSLKIEVWESPDKDEVGFTRCRVWEERVLGWMDIADGISRSPGVAIAYALEEAAAFYRRRGR